MFYANPLFPIHIYYSPSPNPTFSPFFCSSSMSLQLQLILSPCFYLFLCICAFISLLSSPLQGKKNSVFRECYFGNQRHCKLTRLYPACGYTFRVAAHNDIGTRYRRLLLNTQTYSMCYAHIHSNVFFTQVKNIHAHIIINSKEGRCHNSFLFLVHIL